MSTRVRIPAIHVYYLIKLLIKHAYSLGSLFNKARLFCDCLGTHPTVVMHVCIYNTILSVMLLIRLVYLQGSMKPHSGTAKDHRSWLRCLRVINTVSKRMSTED